MRIYFYPHAYLRDRHLDTIRSWPQEQVVNPGLAERRFGAQVSAKAARQDRMVVSLKQRLPLLNVKLRPHAAPSDAVVYVWGGLIATGKFIVDLDNPWALTAYNLRAMPLYRWLIRRVLLSDRCVGIRCMSGACRQGLRELFGPEVFAKAEVCYPRFSLPEAAPIEDANGIRMLFVGTQFEIKGGAALLGAFSAAVARQPRLRLDIVTHLPEAFAAEAAAVPGLQVHAAHFTRTEIEQRFMRKSDVLVLPTYIESFGMVALEALAHGLAIIATDVYALREIVDDGNNGRLLEPPISAWDGVLPAAAQYDMAGFKARVRATDVNLFERELADAMVEFAADPERLRDMRRNSRAIYEKRFR